MMRTGEQYLESLRDGRRVMCGGELIEDITSHPKTSGYASQVAEFYDLHLDPKHQEHLTYIDEDGVRRAKHWMMPKNKEQAVERREYFDYIFRHFRGGQWSRLPCSNNTVMMLLVDDPEPWEAQTVFGKGKPMADNIRRAWADLKDGDLAASPMFIDIQFDRSGSDHTDIPMLRMIEERDDGILVRGWKAVGTGTVFSNWINVGILWNVGTQPDQVIFCRVPANMPGITHVARDSFARPDAPDFDYPLSRHGDELESMAFFDDVVIPWEYIFHLGNIEHAQYYPQRVFDWVHIETQNRHVINAELMVGLAMLMTSSLGTDKHPVVMSQIADIIRFRETVRAFTIAAEDTGNVTPSGLYKPNNIFIDLGRAFYIENVGKHIDVLSDLCGRSIMMQPTEGDLDDPYIGPHLADALRGKSISARDRMKIVKVIRDRFFSEGGARKEAFEKFNGTPLFLIKLLTMNRVEFSLDGPLVELARQVCGLGDDSDIIAKAIEEKERSEKKTPLPDYVRKQDVETV